MTPRWILTESDDEIHVMPLDDERPHKPSEECPCLPKRKTDCDAVVVHSAWDRREIIEQLTR